MNISCARTCAAKRSRLNSPLPKEKFSSTGNGKIFTRRQVSDTPAPSHAISSVTSEREKTTDPEAHGECRLNAHGGGVLLPPGMPDGPHRGGTRGRATTPPGSPSGYAWTTSPHLRHRRCRL